MPCCFKKNPADSINKQKRDYHLKCIGKLKQTTNDVITIGDKLYILQESNKIISNRFGFLPEKLDNLFNINKNINITNHYLIQTDSYYLKFGIIQDISPYLQAIACALDIPFKELKNRIKTNITKQIFISLNNGDIISEFKTIEKYLEYIDNTLNIDYDLLDDLISTPGIIIPEGLNIYILEKIDDNFKIICKNIENIIYFSDPIRKNIILLLENNVYSTIFKVIKKKEKVKDFIIIRTLNFNDNNIINTIWKYINVACTTINLTNDLIPYSKQLYMNLMNKNIKINYQIIDNRYKCKFLILNNGLILPVRSSGCIYNIPIIDNYNKYLKSLEDTIKLIKDIYVMPNGLIYIQKDNNDYTINALIFNNYYLPIIQSKYSKSDLDKIMNSNYYLSSELINGNIDQKIIDKVIIPDKRVNAINMDNYINEGYELFKLEISNFLQNNSEKYNNLEKLLNISDKNKQIIEIKKFLYSIINKSAYDEFCKLIQYNDNTTKIIENFIIIDDTEKIENYNINNQRSTCDININKDDCCNNPHCTFEKKCKMKLFKNQMINYVNKLTNDLIYNDIKQKEILQINGYYISDIRDFNSFIERDKQTIIKNTNYNIKKILEQFLDKDFIPILNKRKIKKIEKISLEEKKNYPLIQIGNNYYQEVNTNDAIVRAYTNAFYWYMNTVAILAIRNLGYYSSLQNQILNYFKSLIYTWIIDETNIIKLYQDINNIIIPMKDFVNTFQNKLNNFKNITINVIILYILNKHHNIPIIIYDEFDTIIYIIDDKIIPLEEKDNYKLNECLNIKILLNKVMTIYIN
jgi:hypothetical protein